MRKSIIIRKNEKFLDNYIIGPSMGSSSYGEVRKCKHNKTGALRAVKIYKKEKLGDFEI